VKIAVLGTGHMGRALASAFAAAGHSVAMGARTAERGLAASRDLRPPGWGGRYEDAAKTAEMVVLALSWPDVLAVVDTLPLDGKVVIDCSNPETPDGRGLAVGLTSSGAEEIALRIPGALVVKAFNHVYAEVLGSPAAAKGAAVLVCGDHDTAKARVTELIGELGFSALDAGPLRSARYLEPLAMLLVQLVRVQGWAAVRTAFRFPGTQTT
jgi:8-hydroxy-5-deazaflavin:NADPH oxidoreductase